MEKFLELKAEKSIQSLSDSCMAFARLSGGAEEFSGYSVWHAKETFWYNRVRIHKELPAGPEATVNEITEGIRAGRLPPLLGWLDRDDPEGMLPPILQEHGFFPLTVQAGMYVSLADRTPEDEIPPQIEYVSPAEIVTWSEADARGFGKPPETPGMKLLCESGDPNAVFLLWREHGEIVAGTLLYCAGDNGGIHEVFTLPEHRGKGIASALVGRALDIAKARGCGCATLQASELGLPVYRRLGMEEVSKIHNWLLKP